MGIFEKRNKEYIITAACISNRGKVRSNNEDNFYFDDNIMECNQNETDNALICEKTARNCFFAVFDGIGGADYGELASFAAAKFTLQYVNRNSEDKNDPETWLKEYVDMANELVFHVACDMKTKQMGTTMASLLFFDNKVWSCNLGDSRCYRMRKGKLVQISEDHTESVCKNRIKSLEKKNRLYQYLGMNPEEVLVEPTVSCVDIKKDDWFLVMSDGISDQLSHDQICNTIRNNSNATTIANELLKQALDAGGKDNITVIAINIT